MVENKRGGKRGQVKSTTQFPIRTSSRGRAEPWCRCLSTSAPAGASGMGLSAAPTRVRSGSSVALDTRMQRC